MCDTEVPLPDIFTLSILTNPKSVTAYLFLLLLLLLSGFFAGTETAFSYCNRHRLKVYADDESKKAKLALKILENFDNVIITTLIGTNIVHVTMSTITTVLSIILIGETYGSLVATLITTLIVFFFGDMLPKNIAKANADKWCMISSYFIYFFVIILYPISFLFNLLIKFIHLFIKDKEDEDVFTEDDFQDVVEKIEEEGVIDEEESDIIQNAVDFGDIKVKDILTKREDIVAIDIKNCTKDKLKDFIIEHPYSRIPIYDGSIDNIIGILHVRTYLKELYKNKNLNIRKVLLKPYYVSSSMSLDNIFEGFKEHKTHIAIIRKANKTLGLVTMKEVLEELVGDIDEKDTLDEAND